MCFHWASRCFTTATYGTCTGLLSRSVTTRLAWPPLDPQQRPGGCKPQSTDALAVVQLIDGILFLNIRSAALSLRKRFNSFRRYLAATHNVCTIFPDAKPGCAVFLLSPAWTEHIPQARFLSFASGSFPVTFALPFSLKSPCRQ